jgi:hypothetical protein
MENLVFTQLSVTEVRKMLREEVQAVIKGIHPTKPVLNYKNFINKLREQEFELGYFRTVN